MAEAVEYRILEDVRATLAGITTANGFTTNVRRVHDMDGLDPVSVRERPALCVQKLDTKKQIYDGAIGLVACELPLSIYCVLDASDTWRRDAERLASDVERALASTYWRGVFEDRANAFDTLVEGSQVANRTNNLPVALARVDVLVKFRHPFEDPTAAA